MAKSSKILWGLFFGFVLSAIFFSRPDNLAKIDRQLFPIRGLIWVTFFGFTLYSMYCSSKENLFKTIGKLAKLHWGRQIGLDLYLGLFLILMIIYLHQGPLIFLLWLIPIILFGNLASLLYFAINFNGLVQHFLH